MKVKLLFAIISGSVLFACSPDSLPKTDFSNYTVDKVVCQANSDYLVADNISELDLNVKIYTKQGTYTDKYGEQRDRYVEIPTGRWRNFDIKFYVNGSQVTPPYKTSSTTPATLDCYAEVDGVRSSESPAKLLALYPPLAASGTPSGTAPEYPADLTTFTVKVREAYMPTKRQIPVVFHILDREDNKAKEQELHSSVVHNLVNQLNNVYGRVTDRTPNGANPNIEFVLALKDESGAKMADPGINRVYLTEAEEEDYKLDYLLWIWNLNKTDEGVVIDKNNFDKLVADGKIPVRTPRAYWDMDKYLNIWVLHSQAPSVTFSVLSNYFMPMVYPEDTFDAQAFPIPLNWDKGLRIMDDEQFEMWKKNPGDLRLPPAKFADKRKHLGQAGVLLSKSGLTNGNSDLVQRVGAYLGLIPNAAVTRSADYQTLPLGASGSKVWVDDFCNDTPKYNRWFEEEKNGGIEAAGSGPGTIKYTMDSPYFVYRSTNIMESGTNATSVSQDQVKRMQWVFKNAPGRQWNDTSAID